MKKLFFDIFFSFFIIILLLIPMLFISIIIRFTSNGSVLYWSERVGRDNVIFKMPKFRTMQVDAPTIATHLISDIYITPIGCHLRRLSLDELPQLFSIMKGDMSLVGPRPALYNQDDLIALRTEKGVDKLLPGLTGWAQINGRDDLSMEEKVAFDVAYLNNYSFLLDLKILWATILMVIRQDNVSH